MSYADDGFVRVDGAFSAACAAEARRILWRDTGCEERDPRTWTRPVIRLGMYGGGPFLEAIQSPVLVEAIDALVGAGTWQRRFALGTFPVRFPSTEDPGDTGWHVDASFPGADPSDAFSWRVNARSRGRLLLALFLFSDVGEDDAPTRIRVGSHREVAEILAPHGEEGLDFTTLASRLPSTPAREALAFGPAGTVYLCHPFLVHAAQRHRGRAPRFLAQPPILPAATT